MQGGAHNARDAPRDPFDELEASDNDEAAGGEEEEVEEADEEEEEDNSDDDSSSFRISPRKKRARTSRAKARPRKTDRSPILNREPPSSMGWKRIGNNLTAEELPAFLQKDGDDKAPGLGYTNAGSNKWRLRYEDYRQVQRCGYYNEQPSCPAQRCIITDGATGVSNVYESRASRCRHLSHLDCTRRKGLPGQVRALPSNLCAPSCRRCHSRDAVCGVADSCHDQAFQRKESTQGDTRRVAGQRATVRRRRQGEEAGGGLLQAPAAQGAREGDA